jgi:Ca-activated chloride channel homolog
MFRRRLWLALLLGVFLSAVVAGDATAQVFTLPSTSGKFAGQMTSLDATQAVGIDNNIFRINTQNGNSVLENPSSTISKLDLKAPGSARHEFEKGYQLLLRKDLQGAIEHLTKSTSIYPSFVAAHNALGTAYLNLGQNQQAHEEFARAVALDDHLPNSYLNLGCAQLALKQYADAEASLKRASSIAPLDLQLGLALIYGEYVNQDYSGVIATAQQVHQRKHEGAALVHYFASASWDAQNNLPEAQHEMETLLKEDPKSPSAGEFRQILDQLKAEQVQRAQAKQRPGQPFNFAYAAPPPPNGEEIAREAQQAAQDIREQNQIAEAEAEPDAPCMNCRTGVPGASAMLSSSNSRPAQPDVDTSRPIFRVTVDEVAVFFAATDHGQSVTNLTASEVQIRDDNRPPADVLAFRNLSQLPLRVGLVIDTSNSVTDRFAFEQAAATKFLQAVVTGKDDLAFVVGVNNSVFLEQDFTGNQALIAHAINQLAPGGGTALWDAVSFAADKLTKRVETQRVARILVVISDGEDNSSSVTLKQAIETAQRGEVAIYTVSTREGGHEEASALLGDHALKILSDLTGGSAFMPGSVHRLNGSLADLQQVIRGRYLVSYKPASFQLDGRYRTIDIKAEKDGHKLKVYSRKGYYASTASAGSNF